MTAAALAVAAGAVGAVTLASVPAQAAACENPIVALIPSGLPNKDMALGFANGSTHNAPLAMRDSSGISRAEMWQEFTQPNGTVVLRNVNTDAGTFNAAVASTSSASAVVAKFAVDTDTTQRWHKNVVAGFATYTSAFSGLRITAVLGATGKPFQQFAPGVGGDQFFAHRFIACP